MRVAVDYGRQHAELEVDSTRLIQASSIAPPSLSDPAAALAHALEHPHAFPALRRALIPDDQVTVLVDERLPLLGHLLVPLLDHILSAGVQASAITLLCQPSAKGQPWLEDLPEHLEEVRLEIHDPNERDRLSYIAATQDGKPLYINRSAVDAGQLIVLSDRRFDALLGYDGGESALFPAFSDAATRQEATTHWTLKVPGEKLWTMRRHAIEAAWLMGGAAFFVQIIEGAGDGIAEVIAGAADSCEHGKQRLDACWRRTVPSAAQTVIATVSGDPVHQTFADLADALTCASRVVAPQGRIVLLSEIDLPLSDGFEQLRGMEDPGEAQRHLDKHRTYPARAAWQWATLAQETRIYLLAPLSEDVTEELFAVPLGGIDEVQRLAANSESCLILNDAHKTLALVE